MEAFVKEGILYKVMENKEEVIHFLKLLTDVFMVDQATLRGKHPAGLSFYKDYEKTATSILKTGLAVGAYEKETAILAGGIIIEDRFGVYEGDPYEELDPIIYPTMHMINAVVQQLINEGTLIKEKGRYLHLDMIAVHPAFRGRGIARELTKINEVIAKEKVFEYSYVQLSSIEYQNLCLGNGGYTVIKSVPFLEVMIDGKAVFEDIKPHLRPGEEELSLKIALKKV